MSGGGPGTPIRNSEDVNDASDPLRTVRAARDKAPGSRPGQLTEESRAESSFSFKKRQSSPAEGGWAGSPFAAGLGKRSLSGLFARRPSSPAEGHAEESTPKHLTTPSLGTLDPNHSTPSQRSASGAAFTRRRVSTAVGSTRSVSRNIPMSPPTPPGGSLGRRIQDWQHHSGISLGEGRNAPGSPLDLQEDLQEPIVPRMLPTLTVAYFSNKQSELKCLC